VVAYVIFIKEKTKNQAEVQLYKQMAPAGMAGHPITFRIAHGRREVVKGPDCEDMMMLEFPTCDAAKAWYGSPAYQAASEHRFKGADYLPSSLRACRRSRGLSQFQSETVPVRAG
jgi:uncharacterized protein (DUF1330 family)